jgi:hypothetical protein
VEHGQQPDSDGAGSAGVGSTEPPNGTETLPEGSPSTLRRDMVAAVGVILALASVVGVKWAIRFFSARPSDAQCTQLLDRYLEQASRQRSPGVQERDIADAQQMARGAPAYVADLSACKRQLTASQVECGLQSPNVDEMERCLQ